ncbi:MAG: hypothetical protein LH475_04975 [Cryobacterium sp.]|uniref:thiamine pyrophosphate-binding protein n=1 Tax=Cryobacterium sp. TaxID=1926290 RepID=UPI002290E82F|nr:thiamine pyrophosphate-binding protein [Cryobacterium sp.]MCY7403972.1 hypothetical protein [Cryobacterium sp.]
MQARCQDLTDDARLGFAIIAGPGVETEGVTGVVQRMLARLKDKPVSVSIEQQGVDLVFGILGTHNLRIYRALAGSAIRHLTPRHEQGAGYTADRYARAGAMAAKTRRQASGAASAGAAAAADGRVVEVGAAAEHCGRGRARVSAAVSASSACPPRSFGR